MGLVMVGIKHGVAVFKRKFEEAMSEQHITGLVTYELKAGAFEPGDGMQLGMYMRAVDKLLRHPDDKPTIGLLLVREKNRVLVEYALGNTRQPISVAEWETQLTQSLPASLRGSLPTIEEIEAELSIDLKHEEQNERKYSPN
jgi:hypothetical protein